MRMLRKPFFYIGGGCAGGGGDDRNKRSSNGVTNIHVEGEREQRDDDHAAAQARQRAEKPRDQRAERDEQR